MKKFVCIFFVLALFFQLPVYADDTDYVYTASIDGVCSLYISPSVNSYELMKIPACSELELLETDGTWNQVKYKNHVGWINSCYIRSTYSDAAMATGFDEKKTVQVDTGKNAAKMYPVPLIPDGDNGEEGTTLPDGTILEMLRQTPSGWGLITVSNGYMWIDTAYTRIYEGKVDEKQYGPYYVYVFSSTGNGVNMWESPDKKQSIAVIPECTQLIAREENGNYIYVSYKSMNGWVETGSTEESLFNAQMRSGSEVMNESIVDTTVYGEDLELMSAPSYDGDVAAIVLGTVEDGEDVFVLRTTPGEWHLVLANGVLGWLPPESTLENPVSAKKIAVTVYENPEKGFVSTLEGEGMELVSYPADGVETGVIPESVAVEIIAEKDGYKYVRCEYGAGWTQNAEITSDYKESLTRYANNTESPHITNQDTFLMSLPAEKGSYGSKGIIQIKKNVKVAPLRIIEISDNEWALVEIDGTLGWIDLDYLDSTEFPVGEVVLTGAAITFVLAVFVTLMKRRKTKKSKESDTPENIL